MLLWLQQSLENFERRAFHAGVPLFVSAVGTNLFLDVQAHRQDPNTPGFDKMASKQVSGIPLCAHGEWIESNGMDEPF